MSTDSRRATNPWLFFYTQNKEVGLLVKKAG
nr:MAG TPA: hypothetical protein [Caudoviricetes sp.]